MTLKVIVRSKMICNNVRAKAAGIHLAITCLIAALAAILVFGLWFPYPYRKLSGGKELFLIVVLVDVVLGPLLTFAIFNLKKSKKKLYADLAVIAVLQVSALGYGVWSVSLARPVHMVFEYDRFRAIHAYEIPRELISKTPKGITPFPYAGPSILGLRPFKDSNEETDATLKAVQGLSLSSRPDLWQSYEASVPNVLQAARPISELVKRFPEKAELIQNAAKQTGNHLEARYMPVIVRDHFWTAVIDGRSGSIAEYLPIDSF